MKNTQWMLTFLLVALVSAPVNAASKNGFNIDNAIIPADEIISGGPPKDGIPALTLPEFEAAGDADWLRPEDRILGVEIGGTARAYPVRILDWHEVVNDLIGEQFFVVTYCPLCGTGMVFASNAGEGSINFGVSGLLYNSDVLLYDRNSDSLWSQIMGKAIAGPLVDTELPQLPVIYTSWENWLERYPDSEVLSRNTGVDRDYERGPYGNYAQTRRLMFDVSHRPPRDYHPKEYVIGVEVDGQFKAYPFQELRDQGESSFTDTFAGKELTVQWNEQADNAEIFDAQGNRLPTVTGFWFAWYTFHPETEVFKFAPANN